MEKPDTNHQLDEYFRKIDEIHKALFNNPNKTEAQKEEEIIELMMARKVAQGVQKRNKGK